MLHLTEIATLPVEEAEDTFELHRCYLFDFDQDIETHATNARHLSPAVLSGRRHCLGVRDN
jgi:hypothetical protein